MQAKSPTGLLILLGVATVLYCFRLGSPSLGASESYSVYAAIQPDVVHVIAVALRFDPGKPPLYHIWLHWFCGAVGVSEFRARALSAIAGVATIAVVYVLGRSMFGANVALVGAALWAFNPLAFMLAQWARMYSLFILFVMLTMLAQWCARISPKPFRLLALTISAALMLYVHMGALLYFVAAAGVAIRDLYIHRKGALRVATALAVSALIFLPFLAIEKAQAQSLLTGHWLDWAGSAHPASLTGTLLAGWVLGIVAILVLIGPSFETLDSEPQRMCMMWVFIPTSILIAISLAMRPLFSPRYFAEAVPAAMLLVAILLTCLPDQLRRLALIALFGLFLVCFICYQQDRGEPWRKIADIITNSGTKQPIFFERGFVIASGTGESTDSGGFEQGYYRIPFDLYYKGSAPRLAIDPSEPRTAGFIIMREATHGGGAWLISGKSEKEALAELPDADGWIVSRVLQSRYITLYRVAPP